MQAFGKKFSVKKPENPEKYFSGHNSIILSISLCLGIYRIFLY